MGSTFDKTAPLAADSNSRMQTIVYWTAAALFCLQMGFTAYAQPRLPQVAEAFPRLGFAFNPASALFADGPEAWGWAAATGLPWALSCFFRRTLQSTAARRRV